MAVRIHYRGYFWSGSSHTEGNALQVPDDFYSLGANTGWAVCMFMRILSVNVCIFVYACVSLFVAVCICPEYLCVCVCVRACVFVCVCVCMCIWVCVWGCILAHGWWIWFLEMIICILPGDGWVSCDWQVSIHMGFIVSLFVLCRLGRREVELYFCQSGIDTVVRSIQRVISAL